MRAKQGLIIKRFQDKLPAEILVSNALRTCSSGCAYRSSQKNGVELLQKKLTSLSYE